jgi:TonB family protein
MSVSMIESVLKVSVILLAALAAGTLLRRRSAALRHWVLAVSVGCACAMPSLSAVLPTWRSAPLWTAAAAIEVPSVPEEGVRVPPDAESAARVAPAPAAEEGVRSPSDDALGAGDVAWMVWLAGTVASLLVLLSGLTRLRWLASRAKIVESGPWWQLGEDLRRACGLPSPVRLLVSDHAAVPITWGWRRPRILLPARATQWSRARLQVVLSHELAHVARGDWAVLLAAEGLRALHWFNPLSWIVGRRLRIESERACDDEVLAGGVDAARYAEHLLALARDAHGRRPWLPAPAMARPSSLEGRIHAMLNTTLNRRPLSRPARTATVAALLALAVAVGGLRAQSTFYSLTGKVLDSTHRVMPGARLVLTNATSAAKHEVQSDATGDFEFVGLPPGAYRLEASLPGFAMLLLNLEIAADTERTLQLELGSVHETINVSGDAVVTPPDPSAAEQREEAVRRFTAFMEREQAKCAAGGPPTGVGGNILAPRKLLHVRPIYPASLKAAGISGTVTMDAVIGTDGLVRELRNVKGPHPDLEAAATDAVQQWRFSTTLLNCEPVELEMHVTINFTVER